MALNILPISFFSGGIWQIIGQTSTFGIIILIILVTMSLISWGIMLNKWRLFRRVEEENWVFLNFYRKAGKFSDLVGQAKSLRHTPLSGVFLEGFSEVQEILTDKEENGEDTQANVIL